MPTDKNVDNLYSSHKEPIIQSKKTQEIVPATKYFQGGHLQ